MRGRIAVDLQLPDYRRWKQASSEAFQVESGSVYTTFKLGYVLREGESLPDGLADEPRRDWTESYQKYQDILGQQR